MRRGKTVWLLTAAAGSSLLFGSVAEAATVDEVNFSNDPSDGETNSFTDVSYESLVPGPSSTSATELEEGDALNGVFSIGQINADNFSDFEITGVFQVEVTERTGSEDDYDFTFGPDSDWSRNPDNGTVAQLWEDKAPDFEGSDAGSKSDSRDSASNGDLLAELGFAEDGNAWTASGSADLTKETEKLATGSYAVSRTTSDGIMGGWALGERSLSGGKSGEFTGLTSIRTDQETGPWQAKNSTEFNFNAVAVPTPSAVWLGLGLLGGLAGVQAYRKRQSV